MTIKNEDIQTIKTDLNALYKQLKTIDPKPKLNYIALFKKQYRRYNSGFVNSSKLKSRYVKELTLIIFFLKLLKHKNPKIKIDVPYLQQYYTVPEIDVHLFSIPSLSTIVELYLIATKIIFSKDEKYFCEFYTPIEIADILINTISPNDLNTKNTFLDPCCGPGSLLSILLFRLIKMQYSCAKFNEFISKSLFGYDILPFSAIISTLQIYTIHQYYTNNFILPKSVNIEVRDSLYEDSNNKFSYIITNPPYKKTRNDPKIVSKYSNVIYGHPNLYLLFLLWSLEKIQKNGHVVFLIPQTLRGGLYNQEFRKLVDSKYSLDGMCLFDQKTNIFPDVEQKVMILELGNKNVHGNVSIKFYAKYDVKPISLSLPYNSIVYKTGSRNYWQVPNNEIAVKIIKKIKDKTEPLDHLDQLAIGTGNYVWNQNKDMLEEKYSNELIPIIYASSVNKYFIKFPGVLNGAEKKGYSKPAEIKPFKEIAILLKRTTTTESRGKINASLLNKEFFKKYHSAYLENHVLYIRAKTSDWAKHYKALICYLNSPLANYYFNTIANTSHISTYELRSMPINLKLIDKIRPKSDLFFTSKNKKYLNSINNEIYKYFGLSIKEVAEIKSSIIRY